MSLGRMRDGERPLRRRAFSRTLDAMAPAPTPPAPGSMTVPPLFGWGEILTVLVLLLVLVVVFLVVTAAAPASSRRSEWAAWLDARSSRDQDPATDRGEPFD
jgi:hypothetical protein